MKSVAKVVCTIDKESQCGVWSVECGVWRVTREVCECDSVPVVGLILE